ncbi:MAG: hypothetical protein ACI39R_04520 [Lachnospiraceae bacterium]
MKKRVIWVVSVAAVLLVLCVVVFLLTKGSPCMEIELMIFNTCIYKGGVEEATEDEIGELLGTAEYNLDHDATLWQKYGYVRGENYNVYSVAGHSDRMTLIVENHKGKFVKVYFGGAVYGDYDNGSFKYIYELYDLKHNEIESVTATGYGNASVKLNDFQTEAVYNLLLQEYPYVSIINSRVQAVTLEITLKSGTTFSVRIDTEDGGHISYSEACYSLSEEALNSFMDVLPEELFAED